MTSRSEDEIKRATIAAMGEGLGTLHFHLVQEVSWLHLMWQNFREVFATDPSRFDVMNRAAPIFFVNLQELHWQDTILHITRLTDKGSRTLSLLRYPPKLRKHPELLSKVNLALAELKPKTEFAFDWRHRWYAHRNLAHAVSPDDEPLKDASREKVEAALLAIQYTVNAVEKHFMKKGLDFFDIARAGGGGNALLSCLDEGLEAQELREARGQYVRHPRFR